MFRICRSSMHRLAVFDFFQVFWCKNVSSIPEEKKYWLFLTFHSVNYVDFESRKKIVWCPYHTAVTVSFVPLINFASNKFISSFKVKNAGLVILITPDIGRLNFMSSTRSGMSLLAILPDLLSSFTLSSLFRASFIVSDFFGNWES